jgi:hypothetical protein
MPEGVRKIYERSGIEPAEYQRLTRGKAKQPQAEQRQVSFGTPGDMETHDMGTDCYNCDDCNAEIKPGEICAAWSVWREDQRPVPVWELEYLEAGK